MNCLEDAYRYYVKITQSVHKPKFHNKVYDLSNNEQDTRCDTMGVLVKVSRLVFVCLVKYVPNIGTEKCIHLQVNEPGVHKRCVKATEDYINLTSISRVHCTATCLLRSCSLINNNFDHDYCLMTNDKCIWLELVNGFEVIDRSFIDTNESLKAQESHTFIHTW